MCTTRSDSLRGPRGRAWGSLPRGRSPRLENKISGHNRVGHRERGLGESVTFGVNRLGILQSDAAGGRRGSDWRPPPPTSWGWEKARPRPRLGWARHPCGRGVGDAADRGTRAEPRDRKRKFACLSHPPQAGGADRWRSRARATLRPQQPIFSCRPLFPGGGPGAPPLCPARGWTCADWGPGRSPRDARRGLAVLGAGGRPLSLHLSRPPSIRLGFPLRAYGASAVCSLRTGGALEPPAERSDPPFPALFPAAAAPDPIGLCARQRCFRNRLWGASLVGSRVFPSSTRRLPSVTRRRLCPRGGGNPRSVRQQKSGVYRDHGGPAVRTVSVTAMRSLDRRLCSTSLARPARTKL